MSARLDAYTGVGSESIWSDGEAGNAQDRRHGDVRWWRLPRVLFFATFMSAAIFLPIHSGIHRNAIFASRGNVIGLAEEVELSKNAPSPDHASDSAEERPEGYRINPENNSRVPLEVERRSEIHVGREKTDEVRSASNRKVSDAALFPDDPASKSDQKETKNLEPNPQQQVSVKANALDKQTTKPTRSSGDGSSAKKGSQHEEHVVSELAEQASASDHQGVSEEKDTSMIPVPVHNKPTRPTIIGHKYLKPLESRHDGNVCDTEEEPWGGLCYRKCSLLTSGSHAKRKSPWTCCNDLPCDNVEKVAKAGFNNPIATAKMCLNHCVGKFGTSIICNGFDVAGDGSCPHSPGACLTDEELHVGVCYKRCDLLTNGEYPYRSAAATCCKQHSEIACLKVGISMTSSKFEVGGGDGDHDNSTSGMIHMPQEDLTEDLHDTSTTVTTPRPQDNEIHHLKLKPVEMMEDGNVCGDTEEFFEGLCYRKCSLFTNGLNPIRTSAWTCCEQHPCNFKNTRKAAGVPVMCRGYGVSGDGSCPHKPGACLDDEELYLGVCYKKCSILTEGKFAHRSAAATCCKSSGLGCLMPSNILISKEFAAGGGSGDSDPSTPSQAHAPMTSLTEDGKTSNVQATSRGNDWKTWKVIANGNVNVRQDMSLTSLRINVKKAGSLVVGRRQGDWLELQGEGGFIMIKFKGLLLLGEVDASEEEPASDQHKE